MYVKTFHPANTPQTPRNHPAITSLTDPPVLPPLQGPRPVSAAVQADTEDEQRAEALKDCLGAASTAFTAREVSGWCICRFMYVPCPFAVDIFAVTDCAACEPMLPIALADEK